MSESHLQPIAAGAGAHGGLHVHDADVDEDAHGGHAHSPYVAHQFDDLAQQKEAVTLGMWSFLATEVMFFGGAFLAYFIYRSSYFEAFAAASRQENIWLGLFNTCVLLCSSLSMALAVHSAHGNNRKGIVRWVAVTMVFGLAFLGVKAIEYTHLFHEHLVPGAHFDVQEAGERRIFDPHPHEDGSPITAAEYAHADYLRRGAQIFFSFYFAATGLHATHMVVGLGIMIWLIVKARRGAFNSEYYNPVEVTGLYWHFVDIVWIFLYPLLYLVERSHHG